MEKGRDSKQPCLDLFWEEADLEAAADHPLARELQHQIDALTRYERLIADTESAGEDDVLRHLLQQHARQLDVVRALTDALALSRTRE